MVRIYRRIRASNKLTATFRRFNQERSYKSFRRAIIALQSHQRRKVAVEVCKKLRDPFFDMTFKQCKELLATEQKKLNEAIEAKNFRRAAELEQRM
jgi:hypothetical protein